MEISITSREMVKPTCEEVLLHKKPFKLSAFDQLTPTIYMPAVLFYTQPENFHLNSAQLIDQLKQSLSKTLNRFYPLSGRIVNHMYVGSYEEGVIFVEAKVNGCLSDYVEQANKEEAWMDELLPCQPYCIEPDPTAPLLAIQVNLFDCGGLALGVCHSHKLFDGSTFSCFLKTWSAFARGQGCDVSEIPNPDFDNSLCAPSRLFPPLEQIPQCHVSYIKSVYITEAKCKTKKFVFNADAIATLKLKAKSELLEHPTRAVAVTAFLWKHAILASRLASGVSKPALLAQAVNLRPRMKSQLPNYAIGNVFWSAVTAYDSVDEKDIELPHLAYLVREAVKDFERDCLDRLQANVGRFLEGLEPIIEQVHEHLAKGNVEFFSFSSLLNTLDEKGVDFGWGEPSLYTVPKVDTRNGGRKYSNDIFFKEVIGQPGAVEATITLEEKTLAVLEQDPEFLQFASPSTYQIKPSQNLSLTCRN